MSGWTDYSFPDLYLAPPLFAVQGLVNALNERREAVSLPKITAPFPLASLTSGSVKQWISSFLGSCYETIPRYVNHTVNGGIFSALDAIPFWTAPAIFTYLDEPALDPGKYHLVPKFWAAWARQQYRVINLLRALVDKNGGYTTFYDQSEHLYDVKTVQYFDFHTYQVDFLSRVWVNGSVDDDAEFNGVIFGETTPPNGAHGFQGKLYSSWDAEAPIVVRFRSNYASEAYLHLTIKFQRLDYRQPYWRDFVYRDW